MLALHSGIFLALALLARLGQELVVAIAPQAHLSKTRRLTAFRFQQWVASRCRRQLSLDSLNKFDVSTEAVSRTSPVLQMPDTTS